MRHPLLRGLVIAALLTLTLPSWASPIVYKFRILDDNNATVAGATVALNTAKSFSSASLGTTVAFTTTSAGTAPYTTSGVAPVWNLTANNINVSVIDLSNGDYGVAYDPEGANGEILLNFTVSKAATTITGSNASISLVLTKDSSRVLNADVASSTLATSATQGTQGTAITGIKAKTDLLATNAADSPNAVTAQTAAGTAATQASAANGKLLGNVAAQTGDAFARIGAAGAGLTAIGDTRLANLDGAVSGVAAAVWGVGSRTLTAFSFNPATVSLSANDEQALTSLRGSYVTPGGTVFSSAALANAPTGGGGSFPANFGLLNIDSNGKVALQSGEHTSIQSDAAAGVRAMTINGRTFAQLCTIMGFNPAGTITSMTRSSSAPWTITTVYSDGSATATYVSTFTSNTFATQIGRPTVTFTGLP